MRIVFSFNIEDWMAFQALYVEQAKNYRLMKFITAFIVPFVFLSIIVYDILLGNIKAGMYIIYFILSILWIVYILKTYKKSYLRKVKKMLIRGDNNEIFGSHEVVFTDEGITHIQAQSKETVTWAGIQKLEENEDYFFLFIDTLSALIIPKKKIESDLEEVNALIKAGMDQQH
jgi:hypothetical protein